MPRMRFVGADYQGLDPTRHEFLRVTHGGTIEVSEEKAKQLLSDFPGEWEVAPRETRRPKRRKPGIPRRLK